MNRNSRLLIASFVFVGLISPVAATPIFPNGTPIPDKKPAPKRERVQTPASEVFIRNNPDYLERSGKFYEETYLPGAVTGLTKAVADKRLPEATARELLKNFIYDWLEGYIAEGGNTNPEDVRVTIDRLDQQIREIVGEGEAFKKYVQWRENAQGDNPLTFLFNPERVRPQKKLRNLRLENNRPNG